MKKSFLILSLLFGATPVFAKGNVDFEKGKKVIIEKYGTNPWNKTVNSDNREHHQVLFDRIYWGEGPETNTVKDIFKYIDNYREWKSLKKSDEYDNHLNEFLAWARGQNPEPVGQQEKTELEAQNFRGLEKPTQQLKRNIQLQQEKTALEQQMEQLEYQNAQLQQQWDDTAYLRDAYQTLINGMEEKNGEDVTLYKRFLENPTCEGDNDLGNEVAECFSNFLYAILGKQFPDVKNALEEYFPVEGIERLSNEDGSHEKSYKSTSIKSSAKVISYQSKQRSQSSSVRSSAKL